MQEPDEVSKQAWIVLRFNHFDPTWRRCWDRDFEDGGRRFVSYRAIEERWISDAIATCADGAGCFMVECSWVLRHYLERHPEQVDAVRSLAQEGRFELLGSGENIVDANMIHGETLVRNLVLGTRWARETLGVAPTTGWHSDGFGSCAQMPQVFRQCGYDWVPAISYNTPDAPYWRGLDGSTVFFSDAAGRAGGSPAGKGERLTFRLAVPGYCYVKLPPCPVCGGRGCEGCRGEGFVITNRAEFAPPTGERLPGKAGVMLLWGEEIMPGLHVEGDIARFNADHPDITVRQGIYRDLRAYLADYLERTDHPPASQVSTKVENNPSQSGCYVSRIKIKQQHRSLEHAVLSAECWDALLHAGAALPRLREAWQGLTFSAFHDAITSSHCDPAYDELCDLHRDLGRQIAGIATSACRRVLTDRQGTITVFNHHAADATAPVTATMPGYWKGAVASMDGVSLPVYAVVPAGAGSQVTFLAAAVPALGARTVTLEEAPAPVVESLGEGTVRHGGFTVHAGGNGITGIDAGTITGAVKPDRFLFGELVLEHDVGDPWATRTLDRARERLSPFTRLAGITRSGGEVAIRYEGKHPACDDPHRTHDPHVSYLSWEQTFRLRQGVPWMEIETRVRWYTQSRRLRLAFPSSCALDRGVFDVPHGVLERDRYEGQSTHGGNAGGDWPAVHWAGIQTADHTFAIFNRGTPSYRIEDGVVMVSVLRSPQLPYALLEPQCYVAHNYGGMVDHGDHVFHHALLLAPGDWRRNDVVRQAVLFNSGLTTVPGALTRSLPGWTIQAGHTLLAAVKAAEDGDGLVLRFVECAGAEDVVRLTPPSGFGNAQVCTLMEDAGIPLKANRGMLTFPVGPWKIVTLRLHHVP